MFNLIKKLMNTDPTPVDPTVNTLENSPQTTIKADFTPQVNPGIIVEARPNGATNTIYN